MCVEYREILMYHDFIVMYEELFQYHGLSLDRLRNFLMIAEKGSIAAVAERDPSRQSLLSRQVRELESYFGVELTRRHGKGIVITEHGRELAEVARRCFDGLQDFKLRKAGRKPLIRIGAGFSTMQWLITPHLKELGKILTAELEMVRMRSRDAAGMLTRGELDFAVVRADAVEAAEAQLEVFALGGCGYSLYGAEGDLPLAVPTGGGRFEQELLAAIGESECERIHCGSLLQMAALVIDEQARAVLPDIASHAFRKMEWVKKTEFPPMEKYRREWVMAAGKRQMETRGIGRSQLLGCARRLST